MSYKAGILLSVAALSLSATSQAATIMLEGEAFQFKGKWIVEKSSDCLGTAMLRVFQDSRADESLDALTVLNISEAGKYRVWVRSQDFAGSARPRTYTLTVDGKAMTPCGAHGVHGFFWEPVGEVDLDRKQTLLRLSDTGLYFGRCDAILLTTDSSIDPNTLSNTEIARWRRNPVTMDYSTAQAPCLSKDLDISTGYTTLASAANDNIRISFVRLPGDGTIVCKTDFYAAGSWRRFHSAAEDNRVALMWSQSGNGADPTFNHNSYYPAWENSPALRSFTFEGNTYQVSIDGDSSNPFFSATLNEARATKVSKISADCIKVVYDCGKAGTLTGYWTVPDKGSHIAVRMVFKAAAAGTCSIALHGGKSVPDASATGGIMPPMYAGHRLPDTPQMLFSSMMTQCISAISAENSFGPASVFITAEPSDFGDEWGSYDHSPVGFTLRNSIGELQPVAFAPLPGMKDSKVKTGQTVEAHFNIGITQGTWVDALEYASETIFGVSDYRRPTVSLTTAIENIISLIKDDTHSGWSSSLKGFWDIEVDGNVSPTVVQAAPLALVGAATLTDDQELYEKRSLPTIEYALSRAGYRTRANAPQKLDPFASQFPTTLYEGINSLTGDLNPWLVSLAIPDGETRQANGYFSTLQAFRQELSAYRLTGDESRLDRARELADLYVEEIMADRLAEMAPGSFYNSQMCPDWTALLDIYRSTGDSRYIDAATHGATHTIAGIKTWPAVKDGMQTIHSDNKYDGVTTIWWKGAEQYRLGFPRKEGDAPEHEVEAWSVSPVGLGIEQPSTYFLRTAGKTIRPVFMTSWAPRLMELASVSGKGIYDTYGRNAVIGRAASYPGYYATGYTDITGSEHFPYRGPDVSSIYYHHIPAYLAMMQDCLVTEVISRSNGAVYFEPARQEGFVWFANNIYGNCRGVINGEAARLWMPAGAVSTDRNDINILTAKSASHFFIMLTNDGNEDAEVRLTLSDDIMKHIHSDSSTLHAKVEARRVTIVTLDADFEEEDVPALYEGMTTIASGTPAGTIYLYRIRSPFGWDSVYGYADCGSASGLTITAECKGTEKSVSGWPFEWSFARFGYSEDVSVNISIAQNGTVLKTISQTLSPATSSVDNVRADNSPTRTGIYTINGISIDRITSPGIYIVDGRLTVHH